MNFQIKALAPGSHSCKNVPRKTKTAVDEFDKLAEIEQTKDIEEISHYQMLVTPAPINNGRVIVQRILKQRTNQKSN